MKLRVLNAVLAGANSMSLLSGGGSDNRSSRLYKALVEKELATGVSGVVAPTVDPFLYSVSATVRTGRTPEGSRGGAGCRAGSGWWTSRSRMRN